MSLVLFGLLSRARCLPQPELGRAASRAVHPAGEKGEPKAGGRKENHSTRGKSTARVVGGEELAPRRLSAP